MLRGAPRHEVEVALLRHPDSREALVLAAADVSSTLGWSIDEADAFVLEEAGALVEYIDTIEGPFEHPVVENVQQRMHDEFIDTTWPECPVRGGHPMWLSHAPPWTWGCREATIPLGQLPKREGPHPAPPGPPRPPWFSLIFKSDR